MSPSLGVVRSGSVSRRGENLPPDAAPAFDPQVHLGMRPGSVRRVRSQDRLGALEFDLHQILGAVPVAGQQQRDTAKVRPDVGNECLRCSSRLANHWTPTPAYAPTGLVVSFPCVGGEAEPPLSLVRRPGPEPARPLDGSSR